MERNAVLWKAKLPATCCGTEITPQGRKDSRREGLGAAAAPGQSRASALTPPGLKSPRRGEGTAGARQTCGQPPQGRQTGIPPPPPAAPPPSRPSPLPALQRRLALGPRDPAGPEEAAGPWRQSPKAGDPPSNTSGPSRSPAHPTSPAAAAAPHSTPPAPPQRPFRSAPPLPSRPRRHAVRQRFRLAAGAIALDQLRPLPSAGLGGGPPAG